MTINPLTAVKASRFPTLLLLPVLLILPSCDSVKAKLVKLLDETIEETGGEVVATEHAGPQEPVRKLNKDNFDEFTQLGGYVVVVDFYADRCPTCRQIAPILEGIANSNDKVLLGKLDTDVEENMPLARREKVKGIPDVRIYVNGSKVDGFVGGASADVIKNRIERQIENIQVVESAEPDEVSEPVKPEPAPQPSIQPRAPKPEPASKPEPKPKPKPKPKPEPKPEEQKEPTIKPMEKDWLPPGVERK